MPTVEMRNPNSGTFDEIEPDSADEDFEHEYEELCQKDGSANQSSGSSAQFAHLKESMNGPLPKANQTHQVSDGLNKDNFAAQIQPNQAHQTQVRLPTTFIPRETSICASQDSAFYNNDPAKGETSQDGNNPMNNSQVMLQSQNADEFSYDRTQ